MSSQPNILFIHSDQHRFDSLGCNGNRLVRTPNLDRLAAGGVNFSHAFATVPICSPARASLMTGSWPTRHGCLCIPTSEMWQPARRELPMLPVLMKEVGYSQAWCGKFHKEVEGEPADYGVEDFQWVAGYAKKRKAAGLAPARVRPGLFGGVCEEAPQETSLAWQADEIIRMLEERRDNQPFFVRWDPPEPHLPCRPPKAVWETYADMPIPPWPSFPDPLENKPHVQRRQVDIWGLNDWPWEKFEEIVRLYFAEITHMDAQIGRVLDQLEAIGAAENTLVIYSTDHGDYCGGHGQMDKHFAMYEDIEHVPLILRWPERLPAGSSSDAFVSNSIDIARTILEVAGVEAPESFQGANLLEAATRPAEWPRHDIFAQYFGTESGAFSQRMVRDRRYKYVFNPTDLDEFYDLAEDPGELRNRIDDHAFEAEVRRLKARMMEWMKEIRDPLGNAWTRVHLMGEPPVSRR